MLIVSIVTGDDQAIRLPFLKLTQDLLGSLFFSEHYFHVTSTDTAPRQKANRKKSTEFSSVQYALSITFVLLYPSLNLENRAYNMAIVWFFPQNNKSSII